MTATIPKDRTTKQPVRCFCRNPQCAEDSGVFEWRQEHAHVACPKCGANSEPIVGVYSLVHFMVADPRGIFVGAMGARYRLACEATRGHLATLTNREAASDQLRPVNCPGCLEEARKLSLPPVQGLPFSG